MRMILTSLSSALRPMADVSAWTGNQCQRSSLVSRKPSFTGQYMQSVPRQSMRHAVATPRSLRPGRYAPVATLWHVAIRGFDMWTSAARSLRPGRYALTCGQCFIFFIAFQTYVVDNLVIGLFSIKSTMSNDAAIVIY
jgi:hypothetical protein